MYTPWSEETDENFERSVTERGKRSGRSTGNQQIVPPPLLSNEPNRRLDVTFSLLEDQEPIKRSKKGEIN